MDTKKFCKLVLEEDYRNYKNALQILQLQTIDEKRNFLTLQFAETGIKHHAKRGYTGSLKIIENKEKLIKTKKN